MPRRGRELWSATGEVISDCCITCRALGASITPIIKDTADLPGLCGFALPTYTCSTSPSPYPPEVMQDGIMIQKQSSKLNVLFIFSKPHTWCCSIALIADVPVHMCGRVYIVKTRCTLIVTGVHLVTILNDTGVWCTADSTGSGIYTWHIHGLM